MSRSKNRSLSSGPAVLRSSSPLVTVILVALGLLIGGGVIYVATVDVPAPSQPVEKIIPAERFAPERFAH
ncbi:MAG: hypothetical protein GC191_01100 [Azospirillum sp.]|nr:hypothetical protein [Azospirillum sp.]